jgi:hypothetical protein
LSRRNAVIARLVVVLALLAGAGAFASAWLDADVFARSGIGRDAVSIAAGAAAVLAALLAIAQTLGRYAARAESHRFAAIRYGGLEREMASTAATPRSARPQPDVTLNAVRERMDRYAEQSPAVRSRVRNAIESDVPAERPKADRAAAMSFAAGDPAPVRRS